MTAKWSRWRYLEARFVTILTIRFKGALVPAWPADRSPTRTGPVEADGAVDAQNAPTAPWKTLLVFHELPQGFPHPITHDKPRKSPESYWETRIDPELEVFPSEMEWVVFLYRLRDRIVPCAGRGRPGCGATKHTEQQRTTDAADVMTHAGIIDDADVTPEALVEDQPPAPSPMVPKISGINQRKVWQVQVTDFDAFVKHVAAHPAALLGLLRVDQKALNDRVRVLNGTEELPGVWVSQDTVVTASGR